VKAIDTNVLVRFLVRDDARQARVARQTIERGAIWIPKTIRLETDWCCAMPMASSVAPSPRP
jgi:predicted nucleic-acid-binding protein